MPRHQLSPRSLALALVQALQMWSNELYQPFLLNAEPYKLKEDWFRWFLGEWKVARTIKDGRQELVRRYLDQEFRQALLQGHVADVVDDAAQEIQRRHWSSQKRKDGQGSLPISLVSKIGFFLCPSELVPKDRYAVQGLNILRREGGIPRLKGRSYREYLDAFNEQFAQIKPQLSAAMMEPWAITLAEKLHCPAAALKTTAMRRKVFDDYLMHAGGYMASEPKPTAS